MPSAAEVRPQRWSDIRELFDNGEYSLVSGFYDKGPRRVLGERWNGEGDSPSGFPNVAGFPVWHVVPPFLESSTLHALLDELSAHPNARSVGYTQVVLDELHRINQEPPA